MVDQELIAQPSLNANRVLTNAAGLESVPTARTV
jgi:hypothetical protein